MPKVFTDEQSVGEIMSSVTVTITETVPTALVCNFFPQLDFTNREWYVGLLDITKCKSMSNDIKGNNKVPRQKMDVSGLVSIKLTNAHEIDNIEK